MWPFCHLCDTDGIFPTCKLDKVYFSLISIFHYYYYYYYYCYYYFKRQWEIGELSWKQFIETHLYYHIGSFLPPCPSINPYMSKISHTNFQQNLKYLTLFLPGVNFTNRLKSIFGLKSNT